MKDIYKDYLFQKHILVLDPQFYTETVDEHTATVLMLAGKFGIVIDSDHYCPSKSMIRDAARNLGEDIPEPFYRGFPETVREFTPDQLYFDQIMHYSQTYGLGWWSMPGHSILESDEQKDSGKSHISDVRSVEFMQRALKPDTPHKVFSIVEEARALDILHENIRLLLSGNRPLNPDQLELVKEAYKDFGGAIRPFKMPCKDTAIRLLYDFRDLSFCRYLKLSDTIKLLNYIQYNQYQSENLKKLNLRNQDRKLITNVIDRFFQNEPEESTNFSVLQECHEKKKIWCGLLHHIHYQPKNPASANFVVRIRGKGNLSAYSIFEHFMGEGFPVQAACYLYEKKGTSALVRNLNYILSRCKTEKEIEEVLACLK